MRVVIYAPLGSRDAAAHAERLSAAGYRPVTWLDMHSGCIARGRRFTDVDQDAFNNLAYELATGTTLCALHPDTDAGQVQRVASLCRLLGAPCVRLADLPATPPEHFGQLPLLRKDIPLRLVPAWARPNPWLAAVRRWMDWADSHLEGLKNPMVREQRGLAARGH